MSQIPNAPHDKTPGASRMPHDPALTVGHIEEAALLLVQAHQNRVLAAARQAFRRPPDPLRTFAEAVAGSGVVHIRAMQQLNAALSERMRTAMAGSHTPADDQDRVIPASDLLSLLGIYPTDVIRFRLWAIGAACVFLLATFGAGVAIGRSSVQTPALVTTTSPQ